MSPFRLFVECVRASVCVLGGGATNDSGCADLSPLLGSFRFDPRIEVVVNPKAQYTPAHRYLTQRLPRALRKTAASWQTFRRIYYPMQSPCSKIYKRLLRGGATRPPTLTPLRVKLRPRNAASSRAIRDGASVRLVPVVGLARHDAIENPSALNHC